MNDKKTTPPKNEAADSYQSLHSQIAPYSDLPYAKLPAQIKAQIAQEIFLRSWDELSSLQRLDVAIQLDLQRDPAMEEENRYWSELYFKISEIEDEIKRWEMMSDQGDPLRANLKEQKITALSNALADLKEKLTIPFRINAMVAGTATENHGAEVHQGMTKREKQVLAILAAADSLKYPRLRIPKGGKKKLMAICKKNVELFGSGDHPFLDAWKVAVASNRIKTEQHNLYAGK